MYVFVPLCQHVSFPCPSPLPLAFLQCCSYRLPVSPTTFASSYSRVATANRYIAGIFYSFFFLLVFFFFLAFFIVGMQLFFYYYLINSFCLKLQPCGDCKQVRLEVSCCRWNFLFLYAFFLSPGRHFLSVCVFSSLPSFRFSFCS